MPTDRSAQGTSDENRCADQPRIGYNWRTNLTHFSKVHPALGLTPLASFPLRSLADQASDAISVQQRDRELLDDVRTLFGRRVGGPYDKTGSRTGGSDRSFTWWATGPRGRGIARTPFYLLSTRRQAQVGMFLRISREQAPPKVDPEDPARSLWDAAPEDELE